MWTEIVSRIAALSPGILASVNPPASLDAIDALERRIGVPLPDGVRQYLAVMDGQNDLGRDRPLIGSSRFLPVARVIETMEVQCSLFADEDRIASITENRIQPVAWDRRWIPFSEFEGSPRLIVDLHPGRHGTYGQVWQYWPGIDLADDGTVLAPTFGEFSIELLRRLTSGGFDVSADGRLSFARGGDYWLV
jgi:cell wall assembly regulator SMI1